VYFWFVWRLKIKICSQCKEVKAYSEFYVDISTNNVSGLRSRCKACDSAYAKTRRYEANVINRRIHWERKLKAHVRPHVPRQATWAPNLRV